MVLSLFLAVPLAAQVGGGYGPVSLAPATFLERVTTTVTSRVGVAERRRLVTRFGRYVDSLAGDTLVVQLDSMTLRESADGVPRDFDTDGFVGGRWLVRLGTDGIAQVLARPFVPDEVTEVSDVAAAMDDFFPPAPPLAAVGANVTAGPIHWTRLTDSSAVRRYRWAVDRQTDTTEAVDDSVPLALKSASHEEGTLAWDLRRGPLAWSRAIHTELTSRIRGRTIQAKIDQEIVVTRPR